MSETLLNVFGRDSDAAGIARLVAGELGSAAVTPEGTGFHVAAGGRRRFRRHAGRAVTATVSLDHFAGDAGAERRDALVDFLTRSMTGPGRDDVAALVPDLRLAVTLTAEAADGGEDDDDDDLFRLARTVARAADGFVLSLDRGRLWSADGEVLAEEAPEAGAVGVPAGADAAAAPGDGAEESGPTAPATEPPPADRVGDRLLVLTAVAARGLAEDGDHAAELRTAILDWVRYLGLDAELEPAERALLDAPAGAVDPDDRVDAAWRIEAAAVLAWALGLLDLPADDELVVPESLGKALYFPDAAASRAAVDSARLRPRADIDGLAARQRALHWRLREQQLHPGPLDLAGAAATVAGGPLDLTGIALVGGDLAFDGRPVADAGDDEVATALSVAAERHQAAEWLRAGGPFADPPD